MKKNLLLVLMVVAMAGTAFASGAKDNDETNTRPGLGRENGRHMTEEEHKAAMEEFLADKEKLSISGTLVLVNGEPPVVESEGVTYRIMAPWNKVEPLNLTDGQEVSVEGYEMAGPRFQWDNSEKNLMLTKAVVNGEEITIDPLTDHMMGGRGRFGGHDRADSKMGHRNDMKGRGHHNN